MQKIHGQCHCGNIVYDLSLPVVVQELRACGCSFCLAHGARYASHPDGELRAWIKNIDAVNRYRFGTSTAEFMVCSVCGGMPFVLSEIDGDCYAVVNANTFRGIDRDAFAVSTTNFDGEDTSSRLQRRKRNWIGRVCIESVPT